MVKESKKIKGFAYISVIMATILGLKAQSIVYFVHDNIIEVNLTYFITFITILSILLFVIPQIWVYKSNMKVENGNKGLETFLGINILLGLGVSIWAIFVMIMWWG